MAVEPETVAERTTLFEQATKLIKPIVDRHGLEKYHTGQAFSTAAVFTEVDQHLGHIIDVARWLGGLDE